MSSAKRGQHGKKQCEYDCIVVGAGGIGAATAYHLSKDGRRTLLLEQYEIGHTQGSSHGGSRIIRYTHDTTGYAQQMPRTFALWRALEAESGEALLQMTGGLYMGPADEPFLVGAQAALGELAFPYFLHDTASLAQTYPQFRIPAGWIALDQAHTGMLAASRCVATLARQAVSHGAVLRERTRVTDLLPRANGEGVEVAMEGPDGDARICADQVILCAGPWSPRFLAQLLPQPPALRVTRQQVVYYAAPESVTYAPGQFPVFLCAGADFVYGLPAWERPGEIKVALEQETRTIDPEQTERPIDAEMLAMLNQAVAEYLPGISPTPTHAQACLYTETQNRDFIIDRHPEYPQLILAAGFSGRGFKHAIAVGRLLADLAGCEPGQYRSDFWLENYRLPI